ncbi:phage integrase family protein [Ralstonia insidiosa]|uniref:Phage integrase family protein n=1 Tax=Ralstonia insidiosa TaxID=190721 RepID=A0AAC9BIJ2_9RALS|nr:MULTISPECIES: integrase arm-type DNA-binding domain-containing protein [Ralstonia]ANH74866.1 phage integrase family protein [Ralstonia insidiosa]EPX95154.1 integrase [Ralstonia sp. AU12-08]MBY4707480.1 integrase arm-type DNA-binding domain-containing protein [Ralstonia insidiosa]GAQ28302.1 integrase family protein [Ralstonia sp. NT80]
MPLTDAAVRNAVPRDKPYRLADSAGLYLEVSPAGGKYWRFKYRFGGKEKRLALGVYPAVGLKEARVRRDAARKLLADGIDPSAHRKVQKAATVERASNSFETVAREWFCKQAPAWAASHADKIMQRLEKNVFPWLGGRPIAEITAPELLTVLRRIEGRGALDTAHRAHQNCGQIFRYAVATGRAERDPSGDLRGALQPSKHENFAAITDPAKVGELLRAIDAFKGTFVVRCALLLAPLLFVRPGELRKAEWDGFDLDRAEWRYFVTKTKTEHAVPLASQAVAVLRELADLTGGGRYVFPGRDPKKSMSEAAVNAALRRMGYDTKTEMTGHGFRAMARTILHEELHIKPEVIEHQLAHKVPDALGTAYNRTRFIKERREMMQRWADYLDELKAGAKVLPFKDSAA